MYYLEYFLHFVHYYYPHYYYLNLHFPVYYYLLIVFDHFHFRFHFRYFFLLLENYYLLRYLYYFHFPYFLRYFLLHFLFVTSLSSSKSALFPNNIFPILILLFSLISSSQFPINSKVSFFVISKTNTAPSVPFK